MQIEETVRVFTDESGRPAGFTWRNQNYLVSEDPVRWFSRRNWWLDAKSVQRGSSAHLLEIEMWRLVAQELTAGPKSLGTNRPGFELAHIHDQQNSGSWQLLRTID
jgi:hypothetical protein